MSAAARVERFTALVATHPDNELFRFSLAQALVEAGRPADAASHFAYCVNKKSDWMMPRILLGKWLLSEGKREEARPLLEQALKLAIEQAHEDPEAELRTLLRDLDRS